MSDELFEPPPAYPDKTAKAAYYRVYAANRFLKKLFDNKSHSPELTPVRIGMKKEIP